MIGRLFVLLFLAGPVALVVFGMSLRTARTVESYQSVMDRMRRYEHLARAASDREGVELPLLLAVASAESSGRPDARSGAGAVGLMQLLPSTAEDIAEKGESRSDLTDPALSLRLGARYFRRQLDAFASEPCAKELSLAAYNAGPGNVSSWLRSGKPADCDSIGDWIRFSETRAFVRRVLDYEQRWTAALASSSR